MHARLRAILLVSSVLAASLAVAWASTLPGPRGLNTFASYADLAAFLDSRRQDAYLRGGFDFGGGVLTGPAAGLEGGAPSYTGTNVQVQGVDELDTVKTDGTYVYLAKGSEIVVARAYPATEMSVVARIPLAALAPEGLEAASVIAHGIFVDGSRIAVVASAYDAGVSYWSWDRMGLLETPARGMTVVGVYDLTSIEAPALVRTYGVSGSYLSARMIPPFVYVLTNEYVTQLADVYLLPQACGDGLCASLPASQIRYDPETKDASSYTNVLAASLVEDASRVLPVLTGFSSTVYMSPSALYLAFAKWEESGDLLAPAVVTSTWTSIYKVAVEGLGLEAVASGDVRGHLLNQFSLDEHAGYLRVATTSWGGTVGSESWTSTSNVYVLGASLDVVGKLEGLAPREHIYSARFLGDRAYLVTFEKIDPFFVIDLADPTDPKVLGFLKIPGYSDYLHPYDEDHVIGLGKDAIPDESGGFSWYQGLKLSLFNVSDVENPAELARYGIGDRGSESEALHDHKAFLFAADRGLLVIPVALAIVDPDDWGGTPPPYAYGEVVWIGAYVLRVSLDGGFELVGRVSHIEGNVSYSWYAGVSGTIRRSFLIEDVLYTVSEGLVKANGAADLAEIAALEY